MMRTGFGVGLHGYAARPGWTPAELGAQLIAWWDAEQPDTLTLDDAAVTAWADAIGGLEPAQATAAAQPTFDAEGFNGRPAVIFDGSNDLLEIASIGNLPAGAGEGEIWLLIDQTALPADTGQNNVFGYGASSAARTVARIVDTGANRTRAAIGTGSGATNVDELASDLSGVCVVRARVTATETFVSVNGGAEASAELVPATATSRTRIGSNANTTASGFFEGAINTILVTAPLGPIAAGQLLAFLRARAA